VSSNVYVSALIIMYVLNVFDDVFLGFNKKKSMLLETLAVGARSGGLETK
jgi:hypothetical protein